jgi:hypothetical protein
MRAFEMFLRLFDRERLVPSKGRRSSKSVRRRYRLEFEGLEDRCVPSTTGTSIITSNFNGTAIPAGDTLWFSSVFKPSGVTEGTTLQVTNQTISFTAAGTPYSIAVPDSIITFSAANTTATTTFDTSSNTWVTNLPLKFSGNGLLGGVSFLAAGGLPGGINPVTWQATFTTATSGISLNWQWATAVYKAGFPTDYNALNVKPLDATSGTLYAGSDHAGTPENSSVKALVTGGARGGGGSNFTGSLSPTATVFAPQQATISGFVFANGSGVGGVTVTLIGTDFLGNSVTFVTTTMDDGSYEFTGLLAGTYMLDEGVVAGFDHDHATVGTVNFLPDGSPQGTSQLVNISLVAGNNGVNYDFYNVHGGS